jgi:NAD-reducing hydrogenase small subunit
MRNPIAESQAVLHQVYGERPPDADVLPQLLPQARPLHELVPVEVYLPGCPPSAAAIRTVLEALLRGEQPRLPPDQIRFG